MKDVLEKKILNLTEQINSLPEKDKKNVVEFVEHGEWGIALDTLCNQIYEHDLKITKTTYDEIEAVGKMMNMNESTWSFLKKLIV